MNKTLITFAFGMFALSSGFAREIKINAGAGPNWKSKMEAQSAIWLEDLNGNFVSTLYVSGKAAKNSWIFSPKEGRPESLPVWYHASKTDPSKDAKKDSSAEANIDAVSSATQKKGIFITRKIADGDFVIKAEFNTSFDYNDSFTKKNSGVNGQPSVIYGGKIPENAEGKISLKFLGCGSLDGSDGELHKDAEKLTTAKSIISEIKIEVSK